MWGRQCALASSPAPAAYQIDDSRAAPVPDKGGGVAPSFAAVLGILIGWCRGRVNA